MDPNSNRGAEEYGEQPRPAESPATPSGGPAGAPGGLARTAQLVSGPYLLTVNPVDGSEIEPCPPGEQPATPEKHGPQERAAQARAAAPPAPSGTTTGTPARTRPLLERAEETERLVRLLARGRSVRLTGPSGSGRTRLLDAVATACADLAPDGVIRLSGYHRTPTDVMYELFAAVHRAPLHRPDRGELLRLLGDIGAIVVLDDLEFGGAALDELLGATPECAFLLAATPDVAAPSAGSHLEEVFLAGIGRDACRELLEDIVGRPLSEEETAWAADLWFESEGLPQRFVQAGALLRLRAEQAAGTHATGEEPAGGAPLPTVAEMAAPAPLLAAGLGEAARETLRLAVALGGELPHQAHLPALAGDENADASLGDLLDCGLATPAGRHYRLAATVRDQLVAAGYADGAAERAEAVARHYAWWAGHPSVTPERAADEADAILAAMGVLTTSPESGHAGTAVQLARAAAPAFAAALHWSAWERSLRHGQEAARRCGEVAEEAYFHHELGVLALCTGNLDKARAELEASIGLRGVLSDRSGAVAGRRALALVADRSGTFAPVTTAAAAGEEIPDARSEESASPPGGVASVLPTARPADETAPTVITPGAAAATARPATGRKRLLMLTGARRNLVAAGAGALLAAVLGTVVTLGATSGTDDGGGAGRVKTDHSAQQDQGGGGLPADQPGRPGATQAPGTVYKKSQRPGGAGGHAPGTTGNPQSSSPGAGDGPTTGGPGGPTTAPTAPTTRPTAPTTQSTPPTTRPTAPTTKPTASTTKPTTKPTAPTTEPTQKPTGPTQSQTATGPSTGGTGGTGSTGASESVTSAPASSGGSGSGPRSGSGTPV
ncbi:ATP-binding protein [Streptomyces sp. MST-110588]|uniref:ATP-binding protein n=1 Tax=Streptomyces sp. MST-110588 TaxID=2833628 RepID=UPI001F5D382C|nr:ATP-binding protein [Streptomyces sp. MST-110588]UNO39906.1 ATP-binding protein [Streptomyces sp. MST-110588]